MRIVQSYWDVVRTLLSYINRGPWVEREGKKERSVKITFDEFLLPVVATWKDSQPYAHIVCNIPRSQTNIITSYVPIPQKYPSL